MLNLAQKYQQTYLESFCEALRFHKRKHGLTSQIIAEKIKVEKTTVDKWIQGIWAAQGGNLIALIHLFGADFINDILRPFGFAGVYEIDGSETNPFIANAAIANGLSVLSKALRDGKIDHTEKPELKKQLKNLINEATSLLSDL